MMVTQDELVAATRYVLLTTCDSELLQVSCITAGLLCMKFWWQRSYRNV